MNDEPRRHRPLDPRREVAAAGLVGLSIAVPFGVGALIGPLPHDTMVEGRVAWVVATAAVLALGAVWLEDPEMTRTRRAAPYALAVPLVHLLFFRHAWAAALDVVVFLLAAGLVTVRAPARFLLRHHASPPSRRFGWMLTLVLALPGPLLTTGWGLGATILVPAIARTIHLVPSVPEGARAVEIHAEDGHILRGTYRPGTRDVAVLLIHGLNDARDRLDPWAERLSARGAHVLAYDQRAQGVSDGAVIGFADREPGDVLAAMDRLLALSGGAQPTVLGVSMGGGAALAAMPGLTERGVRRVVLIAPASDYTVIVGGRLPSGTLGVVPRGIVDLVSHALGIASPLELVPRDAFDRALQEHPDLSVLLLHGTADHTIPPELSDRLAERPSVELVRLPGAGHAGIEVDLASDEALAPRIEAQLLGPP